MTKMGFEKNKRIVKTVNCTRVKARVGGKLCNFRSKYEYHWAQYLEILKHSGQIKDWKYEPKTFYFKDVRTSPVQYKPDFLVINNDGSELWQELKGHHDGATNRKLQRMSQQFPDIKIELVLQYIPKRSGAKGANRRATAARYCERVYEGTEILKQLKGMIRDMPLINEQG